ncbi:exported protein of unknown function [Shewanella benthica]|uniref:Lipoprotein n=1 Tax=Shewanella benthica TaxID=43661 RepID=A0A330LZY1_9GAMM|nr:hypothetical protein [Shewanella benthica]SQH75969.1 exported protein of unknown function [Shewanella benthica]
MILSIMNKIVKITLITASVTAFSACSDGGSGAKNSSLLVVESGLTLDEVVNRFSSNGSDLKLDVSANSSYGSGNDVSLNEYSFSVVGNNGSKFCVSYDGKDSKSAAVTPFTFNDVECDTGLVIGGLADIDSIVGDFSSKEAGAVVSSPKVGEYEVNEYLTSNPVSFKVNNADVISCSDSFSKSSAYTILSKDLESGETVVSMQPGLYGDSAYDGQTFSVSCDVADLSGNESKISDIVTFNAFKSSLSDKKLVDIIAEASGNTVVKYDGSDYLVISGKEEETNYIVTCAGVLENVYGTRSCIEVRDSENGDIVSSSIDISPNEGIDYKVTIDKNSDLYAVAEDLNLRTGTPVLKQGSVYAYPLLDNGNFVPERAEFYVRNVEDSDVDCYFEGYPSVTKIGFTDSVLDSKGFSSFSLEKVVGEDYRRTTLNSNYIDENGDYNLGNVICTFNGLNDSNQYNINIGQFSGNDNDDRINFPLYGKK